MVQIMDPFKNVETGQGYLGCEGLDTNEYIIFMCVKFVYSMQL